MQGSKSIHDIIKTLDDHLWIPFAEHDLAQRPGHHGNFIARQQAVCHHIQHRTLLMYRLLDLRNALFLRLPLQNLLCYERLLNLRSALFLRLPLQNLLCYERLLSLQPLQNLLCYERLLSLRPLQNLLCSRGLGGLLHLSRPLLGGRGQSPGLQ